ncbi:MAG: hypothetical protein NT062_15955 [Proteobacteria bacterium]|nr:hypothetical protein [Pseudomonadota bacterium]
MLVACKTASTPAPAPVLPPPGDAAKPPVADVTRLGDPPSVEPTPASESSRILVVKRDAVLAQCGVGERVGETIAKACAPPSGMHLVGAPQHGTSNDLDPTVEFSMRVENGHCYRLYTTTASTISKFSTTVWDSKGQIAVQADTAYAVPRDGALCATESGQASVKITPTIGGTITTSVWSD